MRPLESLLAEHPFFVDLGETFSKTVAGCGRQVRFKPGAYLYRRGDAADTFYILRRGRVGLELRGPQGAQLFHTEHAGDVVNAAWIAPPYRCGSDARALETTLAVAVDAACLRGKCEADHDLGYALMARFVALLVERLREARYQALDVYGTGVAG